MRIVAIRLRNFQCFGDLASEISLEDLTYFVGYNGSGKTSVLIALGRIFGVESSLRRVVKEDFHVSTDGDVSKDFYIEVDFEFSEDLVSNSETTQIPLSFNHMQLSVDNEVLVRFRFEASIDENGLIDEELYYIIEADESGEPIKKNRVTRHDRALIQFFYLPARRDPAHQISNSSSALLGKILKATNWNEELGVIKELAKEISTAFASNGVVSKFGNTLSEYWNKLHDGPIYKDPHVSFGNGEVNDLLRFLSIRFSPGHDEEIDFSRLSDGQKSLLYITLILTAHSIGRDVVLDNLSGLDRGILKPANFTILALEEPENSLSPHTVGRVLSAIQEFAKSSDSQCFISTHSTAVLNRVEPKKIRYFKLNTERVCVVKEILLPDSVEESFKYVKEAVKSYPEIYFSRLVVLGEGESEQLVLPVLFESLGVAADLSSVSIVPLGGRHVNHFWRLLNDLEIPYVTLLDMDSARYEGGWGRVRYLVKQLKNIGDESVSNTNVEGLPKWNSSHLTESKGRSAEWISWLESKGIFFSGPIDFDMMLLMAFSKSYGTDSTQLNHPSEETIAAVLGKSRFGEDTLDPELLKFFGDYYRLFKLGSKPVNHLSALSGLSKDAIKKSVPEVFDRMIKHIKSSLKS